MGELKKIALKGLMLLGLLIGLGFVYHRFFFAKDLREYSDVGALLLAVQDSTDILCLSESSDLTISDLDLDKHTITQFLAKYYPKQRIRSLAKGALHAGNYSDILRNLPSSSPVKTVVVTMNLRSFDASWIHSKLETALQKEMVLLKPGPALWRRFMLSLRNYDIKTVQQVTAETHTAWAHDTLRFTYAFPYSTVLDWDLAVALGLDPNAAKGPPKTKQETELACHYVKNFAFQIDTSSNPRIADFDKIVSFAQKRGWHLILNLLPENIEMAERLVGKDLTLLMRQNRDLLAHRYGNIPDVKFVDQLEMLENQDFIDQEWTTEHYFEHGRKSIAGRLAMALQEWIPAKMEIPANVQNKSEQLFFNDCEGKKLWSQMQTLDSKHAHSGHSSSITGPTKGQFGITFTYPVSKFDTLQIDSLAVECWVYQTAGKHNAAIAWEASGDSSAYLWDSIQVRRFAQKKEEWQLVKFRIPLWPNFKLAEIVKVYPYNPSKVDIWFDDIRIEFLDTKNKK